MWNGGVFAFRLGYVLKRAHELIDFKNYDDLFAKYNTLKKISFDYAVVEHEPLIEVMRFSGTWKDLGTWNTLTEAMDSNNVGEALFNEKCENVHVVNELNMPVLCMGLKDVVVSASPEGILVSDKEQSSYIKPFVETFNKQVMFAEKSWGSFRVLDVEKESLTIKVTLNPGHKMNYHSHTNRDEVWTVVSGTGYTTIDMAERIAAKYGVKTINVLTGFKFIGEQIGFLEKQGKESSYIFGMEESYGYLSGSYVRDKDGVNAAFLICEMFAYYASRGIGLFEKLNELYEEYGYCLNTLHSYTFEGSAGFEKMQNIMASFRKSITEFAGKKVLKCLDYSRGIDGLPKSDVLKFFLEDNCSIVVRPSGTEPKLKAYISVSAATKEEAQVVEGELARAVEEKM